MEAMSEDDALSDAQKQAQVQAQHSLDAECAQELQAPNRTVANSPATQQEIVQAPNRAVANAPATQPNSKQARTAQDHKNLVRRLRRQIANKDRQLAQAAAQIAILRQRAAADRAETVMVHAQADNGRMQAPATTVAGGEREGSSALPAQQNVNACQAEKVCGAEQQNQLSVLKQKVNDLEAQSGRYKVQQELARRLYSDLQDEVKSLKSKNYNLIILGHE